MSSGKIIYKTKLSNALTITIGLGAVWSFGILVGLQNGLPLTDPRIPLAALVWLVLSANFLFGFYGELDTRERTFSRVTYFIFRKTLSLEEIREVRYQRMFIVTSYDRSVFVVGVHHGRQVNLYYFSNRNFGERTLARMAHDIKERAPHVKLDAPAEALLKQYF